MECTKENVSSNYRTVVSLSHQPAVTRDGIFQSMRYPACDAMCNAASMDCKPSRELSRWTGAYAFGAQWAPSTHGGTPVSVRVPS